MYRGAREGASGEGAQGARAAREAAQGRACAAGKSSSPHPPYLGLPSSRFIPLAPTLATQTARQLEGAEPGPIDEGQGTSRPLPCTADALLMDRAAVRAALEEFGPKVRRSAKARCFAA